MLNRIRNKSLSNQERHQEKTEFVIAWLVEFRFSTIEILAAYLGLTPQDSSRFFKSLLEKKIIVRFENIYYDKADLVRLGPAGAKLFDTNLPKHITSLLRSDIFEKHERIRHDIELQKSLMYYVPKSFEIISEWNIKVLEKSKRPDALVFMTDFPTAIEFEKTRKSPARIYQAFWYYFEALNELDFDEVHFIFPDKSIRNYYQSLFEKQSWPEFYSLSQEDFSSGRFQNVPLESPVRKRFKFYYLDPQAKTVPVKDILIPEEFEFTYYERLQQADLEAEREKREEEDSYLREIKEIDRREDEELKAQRAQKDAEERERERLANRSLMERIREWLA
jgi:hypothetical protein